MSSSIEEVGFFNPVYHRAETQRNEKVTWLGRAVEWYFDIGQEVYSILPGPVADRSVPVVKEESPQRSFFGVILRVVTVALKIISYLSLILPLMMVVGKLIYRAENRFSLQRKISDKEIEEFIEQAEKTIRDATSSNAIDEIGFERPGELNKAVQLFESITKRKEQFHTILRNSSAFLNEEQYGKFLNAINSLDLHIGKLAAKVTDYKEVVIQDILRMQEVLTARLDLLEGNALQLEAEKAWQSLQMIHRFVYQFRERLAVESIDRDTNWKTEDDTELYDRTLVARLSNMIVPKGIPNLGSTCFMNASIQALIANHEFRSLIKNQDQPIYGVISDKLAQKLGNVALFDDNQATADILMDAWGELTIRQLSRRSNIMNNQAIIAEIGRIRDGIQEVTDLEESRDQAEPVDGEDADPLDPEAIALEIAEAKQRVTAREERLLAKLREELPTETPLLLGEGEQPDWERADLLIKTIRPQLQDFARYKSVMKFLRDFVIRYEERNTKPADLKALVTNLRAAFFFAGRMEGSLTEQQDAPPIIEYVLDAIGYGVPLEMVREAEKVEANEPALKFAQRETQMSQLLQVPIRGGDGVSLQKLVDNFTAITEEGNEENVWRPQHPVTHEPVPFNKWNEKQRVGGEAPKFLQIQLKRFEFTADGRRKKIDDKIDVGNMEVDLSQLFEAAEPGSAKYKIVSGVIHHGSCGGGHYYAITEKAGQHFKCNDSSVDMEHHPESELASAYVLFLEKVEAQAEAAAF